MQSLMVYLLRLMSVLFGMFDTVGVLWVSGLARAWYELLWWSTSAICLLLGGLLPNEAIKIIQVRVVLLLIGLFALAYSFYRVYESWNIAGIDSTNNIVRVLLMFFVIARVGHNRQ